MVHQLHYRRYSLEFRAPVRTAHGFWPMREGLLVRLASESGAVGYGEVSPVPGFGRETIADDEAALRRLGAAWDDATLEAVPAKLACLRNALAAAAAHGNAAEPGGDHPPYLPVAALLPSGREALAQVKAKAEGGFRVFKWKVGVGGAGDELALLDDLCAELPQGALLRLDANGAWDRRAAERWLGRCAERPVEFIEQPVAHDVRGADDLLQGLAADFPVPLALDESLSDGDAIERWIGSGWPGVYVIKPSLVGDVAGILARLAAARASVVFSSALETALGAREALRAAFGWQGQPTRALGFGVWPLFADRGFDVPAAGPFLTWEQVSRIEPEAIWNAVN